MINFDLEVFPQEIRTLKIHSMKNRKTILFIGGLAQIELKQFFFGEIQRSTILDIAPMPFLEASHSSIKVLLKSGRARTRVVQIDSFKY
jgi:hypothetical protein